MRKIVRKVTSLLIALAMLAAFVPNGVSVKAASCTVTNSTGNSKWDSVVSDMTASVTNSNGYSVTYTVNSGSSLIGKYVSMEVVAEQQWQSPATENLGTVAIATSGTISFTSGSWLFGSGSSTFKVNIKSIMSVKTESTNSSVEVSDFAQSGDAASVVIKNSYAAGIKSYDLTYKTASGNKTVSQTSAINAGASGTVALTGISGDVTEISLSNFKYIQSDLIPTTATNLNSDITGLTLSGVGYVIMEDGGTCYAIKVNNTSSDKYLTSVTVSGSFGSSNSLSNAKVSIGPGESGTVIFENTKSTDSVKYTQNDYKITAATLKAEEAGTTDNILPTVTTSNVGNEFVVWHTTTYGKYNGSDIKWRIVGKMENDKGTEYYTLMSDKVLFKTNYASSMSNVTWSTSYLYQYLNGSGESFLNTSFTESERKNMVAREGTISAISGSKVTGSTPLASGSALCYVSIPSNGSLNSYGMYYSSSKSTNAARVMKDLDGKACSYFLANNGYYAYDVAGVNTKGSVVATGWRSYTSAGVVPVIVVKASALTIDSTTVSAKLPSNYSKTETAKITKASTAASSSLIGAAAVGTVKKTTKSSYEVTASTASVKTVSLTKVKKGTTNVTVPSSVKVGKYRYKVTTIDSKAFKSTASTLKKINIKSTNIKKISATAFNGVDSDTTVVLPKSKYKKYKKMIRSGKKANKSVDLEKAE